MNPRHNNQQQYYGNNNQSYNGSQNARSSQYNQNSNFHSNQQNYYQGGNRQQQQQNPNQNYYNSHQQNHNFNYGPNQYYGSGGGQGGGGYYQNQNYNQDYSYNQGYGPTGGGYNQYQNQGNYGNFQQQQPQNQQKHTSHQQMYQQQMPQQQHFQSQQQQFQAQNNSNFISNSNANQTNSSQQNQQQQNSKKQKNQQIIQNPPQQQVPKEKGETQKVQQQKLKQQTQEFQKQIQKQNILIKEQEMNLQRLQDQYKEQQVKIKLQNDEIESNKDKIIKQSSDVEFPQTQIEEKILSQIIPLSNNSDSNHNINTSQSPYKEEKSQNSQDHDVDKISQLSRKTSQLSLDINLQNSNSNFPFFPPGLSHPQQQQQQQQQQFNQVFLKTESQEAQPYISGQNSDTYYRKIFVGGLPHNLSDEEFKAYFLQFGDIEDCAILKDKRTGKPRGFGFVTYRTLEQVDFVMGMKDQHFIQGKWVDCKRAVPANIIKKETQEDQISQNLQNLKISNNSGSAEGNNSNSHQNLSNHNSSNDQSDNQSQCNKFSSGTPSMNNQIGQQSTPSSSSNNSNMDMSIQNIQNMIYQTISQNPQILMNPQLGFNILSNQIGMQLMQQQLGGMNQMTLQKNNINNPVQPQINMLNNTPQMPMNQNPLAMQYQQLQQQQLQFMNFLSSMTNNSQSNQMNNFSPLQFLMQNQQQLQQQMNNAPQNQNIQFDSVASQNNLNIENLQNALNSIQNSNNISNDPQLTSFNSESIPFIPNHNRQTSSSNSAPTQNILQNDNQNSQITPQVNLQQDQTQQPQAKSGYISLGASPLFTNNQRQAPTQSIQFSNLVQNQIQQQQQKKTEGQVTEVKTFQEGGESLKVCNSQQQQPNLNKDTLKQDGKFKFVAPQTVSLTDKCPSPINNLGQQSQLSTNITPQPSQLLTSQLVQNQPNLQPMMSQTYQNSISGFPSFQYLNGQYANPQMSHQTQFKSGFPYSDTFKQQQQHLQEQFNNSLSFSGIGLGTNLNQSLNLSIDSISMKHQEQTEWFIQSLQNQYESSFTEDKGQDQMSEALNKQKQDTIININQQIQQIQQRDNQEEEKFQSDFMNQVDWKQYNNQLQIEQKAKIEEEKIINSNNQAADNNLGHIGGFFTSYQGIKFNKSNFCFIVDQQNIQISQAANQIRQSLQEEELKSQNQQIGQTLLNQNNQASGQNQNSSGGNSDKNSAQNANNINNSGNSGQGQQYLNSANANKSGQSAENALSNTSTQSPNQYIPQPQEETNFSIKSEIKLNTSTSKRVESESRCSKEQRYQNQGYGFSQQEQQPYQYQSKYNPFGQSNQPSHHHQQRPPSQIQNKNNNYHNQMKQQSLLPSDSQPQVSQQLFQDQSSISFSQHSSLPNEEQSFQQNQPRRHILGSGENFKFGKDRPSSRSSQDKNSNIKSEYGQIKSEQKQGPSNRADRTYKPY